MYCWSVFIGLGVVMGVKSPGTDIVFYLFGGIIVLCGSVMLSTIIYNSAANVAKDIKNMEESKAMENMKTELVVGKFSYIDPETNCIHRGDE